MAGGHCPRSPEGQEGCSEELPKEPKNHRADRNGTGKEL